MKSRHPIVRGPGPVCVETDVNIVVKSKEKSFGSN
jgi:hypothetical protein